MVHLYTELPKAEATGKLDLRPESHVTCIEHNAAGKVSGVVYFDKDGKEQRAKRRVSSAWRVTHRNPAFAAVVGLRDVQGRPGELIRPGRS